MAALFPGQLDTFTALIAAEVQSAKTVKSSHMQLVMQCIQAIEATLGVNPQGGSATVVARLDTADSALSGKVNKSGDTMTGPLNIGAGATGGATAHLAVGANSVASGDNSLAAGSNANATASQAIALGENAYASGAGSLAVGLSVAASGPQAVAMGYGTAALSDQAVALGAGCAANNPTSVAIGNNATTGATSAVAIGDQASATGTKAVALGDAVSVAAAQAHGIGSKISILDSTPGAFVLADAVAASAASSPDVSQQCKMRFENGVKFVQGNASGDGGGVWMLQRSLVTTDNSTTEILGLPVGVPTDGALLIKTSLVAVRTGGTAGSAGDYKAYVWWTYQVYSGGVSTTTGIAPALNVGTPGGWNAYWADQSLKVEGAVDTTISWQVSVEVQVVR